MVENLGFPWDFLTRHNNWQWVYALDIARRLKLFGRDLSEGEFDVLFILSKSKKVQLYIIVVIIVLENCLNNIAKS